MALTTQKHGTAAGSAAASSANAAAGQAHIGTLPGAESWKDSLQAACSLQHKGFLQQITDVVSLLSAHFSPTGVPNSFLQWHTLSAS